MRSTLLAVLLILAAAAALAIAATGIDPAAGAVRLAPYVEVLEDPAREFDLHAIKQPAQAIRFQRYAGKGDVNFGYSQSAWWLRVVLPPAGDAERQRWLEVAFASLDRVEVHAEGLPSRLAGDRLPFAERPRQHRHFVFPVELAADESRTLYLRVESGGTLTVPLVLWTADALHANYQNVYAAHALYYGMLIGLGLYNLLLWLSLRERSYLAYVAFVVAMGSAQLALSGLGYQYLWPAWPGMQALSLNGSFALTGFFGALFTRSFLGTARHHPQLDSLIVALAIGFLVTAALPLVGSYRVAAMATSLLGIAFSAVAVGAGIVCLRRGDVAARFFLLAWALLLAGVAAMGMRNLAWLPSNFITLNAIQIGSALEVLLLSFALADRIQILRRDKEAAQADLLRSEQGRSAALERHERELEARVAERTAALTQANERLQASELRLREMAHHDPLTGLANRTLLFDRFEHALELAVRRKGSLAVILLDLDGFKAVNDLYGHEVGDRVLQSAARRLRETLRAADTVSRFGGDEFAVLLEDAGELENLQRIGDKIVEALRRPMLIDGLHVVVGASVGIARWPEQGKDAQELLRAADRAMYEAKHHGRNRAELAGKP